MDRNPLVRFVSNQNHGQDAGYSARRASTGFTDAARRAGRKLAASDASPSNTDTQTKVAASHACTPNNRLRMSIDVPSEHNSPILSPARVSHAAWRITRL